MEFLGCVSAFMDSLFGELNSAAMTLRKLEGQAKGAAFAYEMVLDRHRYGALMILDRWAQLVDTFGPHLKPARHQDIIGQAPTRVQSAENILSRTNDLIDATSQYSSDLVEACILAFQSLRAIFEEEREAAEQPARLGPMIPAEFTAARRMFLADLAAR